MTIEIITGDLLDAKEQYIVHQCNCITNKAAHLAKSVFDRFPYADIYVARTVPDQPGHFIVRGDGKDQRYVIALLGQYYPGSPKYPNSKLDGTRAREVYFHHSLLRLARLPKVESIAFPWKIGCGAAGGNWKNYLGTLTNFAGFIAGKGTRVVIYQREEDKLAGE